MFIESPRFPTDISYGAVGGPGYNTDIVSFGSGGEDSNINWDEDLPMWDVVHGVKDQAHMDILIAFFRICRGRGHKFRFKDHIDFSATTSNGVLSQLTSNTWQMYKRYTLESNSTDRIIQKPVSGTIAATGGGVYTVDNTTGIITRSSGADPTAWSGEFDCPVRFDIDQMKISLDTYNRSTWGQIPIVGVRL